MQSEFARALPDILPAAVEGRGCPQQRGAFGMQPLQVFDVLCRPGARQRDAFSWSVEQCGLPGTIAVLDTATLANQTRTARGWSLK
jgi:hypothetical protein